MRTYDLAVLGSGSGLDVASQAAARGWEVALVDPGPLGGTCLNRGCIPSKMLIHSADLMVQIAGASTFGINARVDSIDWGRMVARVTESVDEDARHIEKSLLQSSNPCLFQHAGRFRTAHELDVGEEVIRAERILVAAGSRPRIPEIVGLQDVDYITSDEALRLKRQRESIVIVGGGDVAAELAHFFGALGTRVTLLVRGSGVLRAEDDAVSDTMARIFSQRFDLRLNTTLTHVERDGNGVRGSTVTSDGEVSHVAAETLLLATGRVPNTDVLDVGSAGIELDEEGFVKVNDYLETSVDDIWALGDIAGRYMLKHSANLEAAYLSHNLFHPDDRIAVDYTAMPHAVFTNPQVAAVGQTERELQDEGRDYLVSTYPYDRSAYGSAIEDHDGFVKVLVGPDSRTILGCHIVGHQASTLIQEVVNAMRAGTGPSAVTGSIYVHPALPEVIQRAFGALASPGSDS